MGMADQEQEWRPRNHLHGKPGQSSDGRQSPNSRRRRVGARVLSEISKPPRRLFKGMVERRELGRDRRQVLTFLKANFCSGSVPLPFFGAATATLRWRI